MKHIVFSLFVLLSTLSCYAQRDLGRAGQPTDLKMNMVDWSIVLTEDSAMLADVLHDCIAALLSIPEGQYGMDELPYVHQMLASEKFPVKDAELSSYKKVRSIQISDLGIFSYAYFKCSFVQRDGTVFFQKKTGSQRKAGYLYRVNDKQCVFLGGSSVNDEPITFYCGPDSVVGVLYKVGPNRLIMVFPRGPKFEIYEFVK